MEFNSYINTFYLTYNLITRPLDKLEPDSEYKFSNKIKQYDNPIDKSDNQIIINGARISSYPENLRSSNEITFKYIKYFPQISTPNYKKYFYKYLKELIINIITKSDLTLLTLILKDNDYEPDLFSGLFSCEKIIEIIGSDDFYELDSVLDLLYPNSEYKLFDKYIELDKFNKAKIPINSIQHYENKLFVENKSGSNNYYFYFSFGTLKNLEQVVWDVELEPYILSILDLISKPDTNKIILGGHSIGSITIQKLAIELIKNNIDTSKIYIIGTGCRINTVLTDEELVQFKNTFNSKYYFAISGYLSGGKINYDHRTGESTNKLNPINTNILICDGITFEKNFLECVGISYDIVDFDLFIQTNNLQPNPNAILHDFGFYSKLYLEQV